MKLDRKEALRYMGQKGKPDALLESALDACENELMQAAAPKFVCKKVTLTFPKENTVEFTGITVESRHLARHLKGCKEAVLFAATLGAPVDLLMQRYSRMDMSRAVILQACAAALIETCCDEFQEPIAQKAAERGLFLRPRYSPGYGDFSIEHQKNLLAVLDAPRKIGLTMTKSFMLAPSKSVTAVIGLTPEEKSCHVAKCMGCTSKNCPFRKD